MLYYILYYTILYYTILYKTILYYTILYTILYYTILYTILYYTILNYTKLNYTILYYTILYYTILYKTKVYYNTIILYYTILYYTILYYTILYYTILYTILYYTILYYTILYYTIYYTTLYYTLLYYTILYYTILYYTILYYTILYYAILYYAILYYAILYYAILNYTILYYAILCYTILYYTILQRILEGILGVTTATVTNNGDVDLEEVILSIPNSENCAPTAPFPLKVGESSVVVCKVKVLLPALAKYQATAFGVDPKSKTAVESEPKKIEIEFYVKCDQFIPTSPHVVVLEGCEGDANLLNRCALGCDPGYTSEPKYNMGFCTVRIGKGAFYEVTEPLCNQDLPCPTYAQERVVNNKKTCYCPKGFSGTIAWVNGSWIGACTDDDECGVGNGGCSQHCHNTIGGFYCSCDPGWDMAPDGLTCLDEDECEMSAPCAQGCDNTAGSFSCSCNDGFLLGADGLSCSDVDECDNEDNAGCDQNCINTVGGYNCTCNEGFQLADDGHACLDINECGYRNGECQHVCHNTVGSYYCSCYPGYELKPDKHKCVDVDECARNIDKCEQNCHNTDGSYYCSCNKGYKLAADKFSCENINECEATTYPCGQNALCVDSVGSYQCSCPDGHDPVAGTGTGAKPLACALWDTCADIFGIQGGSGSHVRNCNDPFEGAQEQPNPCNDGFGYAGDDEICHKDCGKSNSVCCSSKIFNRLQDGYYFLLDTSGSMSDTSGGTKKKITALKEEMKTIIEEMDPERTFNLVSFANDASAFRPSLVKVGWPGIRQAALAYIDSMGANGYTQIYLALENFWNDPSAKGAYLVSDGNPKSASGSKWFFQNKPDQIVARAKLDPLSRPVNTIAIGPEPGASRFLARLACETGGTYRYVKNQS
eukprot:g77535.t1